MLVSRRVRRFRSLGVHHGIEIQMTAEGHKEKLFCKWGNGKEIGGRAQRVGSSGALYGLCSCSRVGWCGPTVQSTVRRLVHKLEHKADRKEGVITRERRGCGASAEATRRKSEQILWDILSTVEVLRVTASLDIKSSVAEEVRLIFLLL